MSPGSNCPQQSRFQAMTETDGSAGRTRLQTCIEGSVAWNHRDPAGTNSWLLSTGGGGRLRDHASGLSTFPWVSEQVESNQSKSVFTPSFLKPKVCGQQSLREPSLGSKWGLTHCCFSEEEQRFPHSSPAS